MTSALLDLPSSGCASSVVMTLAHIVGNSPNPYTFEESFYKWPGEQWRMDFRMPPLLDQDVADEWVSFALKLQGSYGRFLAGDPGRAAPRGVGGGTPLVNGTSQTGNTLNIDGAPFSTTQWLKRGDYFQLGTGASSRLYKLTADATTNGSGEVLLEFVPGLRSSPADNAALTIVNPRGLFRMASNDVSWTKEPGGITRYGFTAFEVLP